MGQALSRWGSLATLGACTLLTGCDTLARSQGKFGVAGALGTEAIGNGEVFAPFGCKGTWAEGDKPFIKIGYRDPFSGKLVDLGRQTSESRQSYYMIIDMTNAIKNPRLGAADDEDHRRRLQALADLLLIAADWNGEVYWRHLTTFLEAYDSARTSSRAALGAAIAGAFISPVLGASLAGGALVLDTFVTDYTGKIDVDVYAALRDATSVKRDVLRNQISQAIRKGEAKGDSLSDVLVLAYDYAFTYSIKGALHTVSEQKDQLKNLLITGDSPWKVAYEDEQKAKLDADSRKKIDAQNRRKQELDAEIEAERAEQTLNEHRRNAEQSKLVPR